MPRAGQVAFVLMAHKQALGQSGRVNGDATGFLGAGHHRPAVLRLDAELGDALRGQVKEVVGPGLNAEPHGGDVAQSCQFVAVVLQDVVVNLRRTMGVECGWSSGSHFSVISVSEIDRYSIVSPMTWLGRV